MSFCSSKNGPYIRSRLVSSQEKNEHTGSTTSTDAFAPASTSGRPRGGRAQVGLSLFAPKPTHSRLDPGPKRPRVACPQTPHYPIHMFISATTTAVCCCYILLLLLCCCCAEVSLVRAVATFTTAAVLLLRLVELRAIF